MSEHNESSDDPSVPPPPLNLSSGGTRGQGFGLNLGLKPLDLSYTCLPIEEKVKTERYKNKSESKLAESSAVAMALRNEIREEEGIEPGSTPTIGNSGERIVIKSARTPQISASSIEGGGASASTSEYINELPPATAKACATTGSNIAASSSAPPSVGSMKKTLSFGHLEIKKIIKITEDDHHKGEGHHSPTVFEGFCNSKPKKIKIESLSPSPASSPIPVSSSPRPSKDD
jgi:hypothetical protein